MARNRRSDPHDRITLTVLESSLVPALYALAAVSGSANGDPRGAGYIAKLLVLAMAESACSQSQYKGYTRFNGGTTNYDRSDRNACANNTIYLDAKNIF